MSSEGIRPPLNDCSCCDGQTASTPARIENRPGLPTIAYRSGDYHSFKDSMLARLSSADLPELQRLTTRDRDDYSIALIDAWANVSEVLCFYQEYLANEGLLRTAKERLSVLEHARLIGYQLNAGVAASTFLAFTMDEPIAGADNPVTETLIIAGSKVQSTPGPDETAQTFETGTDIHARVDWNAIRPRLTQPQDITETMGSVVLKGIQTFVKAGDQLLILNGATESVVRVLGVNSDDSTQTTQLKLSGGNVSPDSLSIPSLAEGSFADFDATDVMDDSVINTFIAHSWKMEDIVAIADTQHWDLEDLMQQFNAVSERNDPLTNENSRVYGFRKRANLFAYNAQKRVTYNDDGPNDISEWDEWERAGDEHQQAIFLDNAYHEAIPEGYLILHSPRLTHKHWNSAHSHYHYSVIAPATTVFKISDVNVVARTAYGISSKSTKVEFSASVPGWDYSPNRLTLIRQADVLIQSEALDLAQVPISETVEGDRVLLDRADLYLRRQQYIAISGDLIDQQGIQGSEVMQLQEVRLENGFTLLIFTTGLRHQYKRNTVKINANVVPASHGESVSEILGSGDSALASQIFSLKQAPLTYTSADVPSGAISSLKIRVNDVLWNEVDTFLDRNQDERIYTTKLDDDGATHVYFGNGEQGARLPSGTNNIIAYYRKGIGLDGLVKAKQLNLLLTRPLGVKDVMNPVESSGADDPEKLEDARSNVPLGLLTLERAVSLSDYEDFSRTFAGIAKAQAVAVSQQGVPGVYISVAGPDGAVLDPSGETYNNLLSALKNAGDPYAHFSLLSYRPAYFKIDAGLYLHPDYLSDLVLEAARQAMRDAYSFVARAFNQPVHLSEVIRTLQQVEGVTAVDVNHLYRSDSSPVTPPPRSIMPARASSSSEIIGAELITLDPAPLDQLRVKS